MLEPEWPTKSLAFEGVGRSGKGPSAHDFVVIVIKLNNIEEQTSPFDKD